jgi:RHS repeat-associated protein
VNSANQITAVAPAGANVSDVTVTYAALQEQAAYSVFGTQVIQQGTDVTPFGFQGSYADSSGLIYLIDRYYDPATDQFLSVDPLVSQTGQPYAFTGDDPLNATDPLGLCPRHRHCPSRSNSLAVLQRQTNNFLKTLGTRENLVGTSAFSRLSAKKQGQALNALYGLAASAFSGSMVIGTRHAAANFEEGAAAELRHYTTADRAAEIIQDGVINPSGDGKTYLTPDEYTDGPTAQAKLAMRTEPEGYLSVPKPPGAPSPTVVEGNQFGPGGGLEVPVPGEVPIPPDVPFIPF